MLMLHIRVVGIRMRRVTNMMLNMSTGSRVINCHTMAVATLASAPVWMFDARAYHSTWRGAPRSIISGRGWVYPIDGQDGSPTAPPAPPP
jgi:hypothetical protein